MAKRPGDWHLRAASDTTLCMRKDDAMGKSTQERFLEKVLANSDTGCWEWRGARSRKGYGAFWHKEIGKVVRSHRYAYMTLVGEIPDGMFVMHLCNNTACCNPQHLRVGSPVENMQHRHASGHGKSRWDEYRTEVEYREPDWKDPYWDRVRDRLKNSFVEDANGCWIWQYAKNHFGHGSTSYRKDGRKIHTSAHRLAYMAFVGDIPIDQVVRHKCDVPSCCNPDHLALGTMQDNSNDMKSRGRSLSGERNHAAVLTEADVLLIKGLLERHPISPKKRTGIGKFIARWFPVNQQSVSNIATGKTWGHI